ncbi:MAG: gamma-glutamyltransferase [Bacteroidota bacterium]|nr:gamma-glutamyltransferase [Bacteroidota bacterium]
MRLLNLSIIFLLLFSCHSSQPVLKKQIDPYQYEINKKVIATNGAIASAHPLASKVGLMIMKNGGNAVDAVIATQLALAVVYPNAGNIGGGGFMVARLANGETISLDYREMAPGAAHRDMYLDDKGNVIPGLSTLGHLSAGVPGTVAGLFESMKYAKLPFEQLIAPAINLAEKGFVITDSEARGLNNLQPDLKKYNTVSNIFQKEHGWKAGDTLIQRELANTLKRIKDQGAAGFYEGETANLIVAEMKRGKGIISLEDLKNYKAKWRTPHSFTYRGYKVISMPMPSSGGVLLNQMLKMVEPFPLAQYGFHSPEALQLMVEVERRAYADRAEHLGDADFYNVPISVLVNESYLKQRMQDFKAGLASTSEDVKPGKIPMNGSEQTTHISVMDKNGNMVAVTTTLNNSYGSKTIVGGAGFLLNDEMDDFSAKPGVPNIYGALGGEANAIAPGKRMLSAMTPTLVLDNEKPFLVIGTPGGTTIITSVFQTIVNIIDFKLSTEEAVNKPKFHHQWYPDHVDVEPEFPQNARTALERMGYKINQRSPIGRTEVIRILKNGKMEAVADNRGDDSAAGY